ncbi:hypothetical protein PV342_32665 [Streptomyces sp. PA03-3a]|nr:hypothetical protein [Streptomyces sp. PA03-3a]
MPADPDDFPGSLDAHISQDGPGRYSIKLIDEGGPGNTNYVETLTFSLPREVGPATGTDQDTRVIQVATDELDAYGYVPTSDFKGGGNSFYVQIGVTDWGQDRLWYNEQPPAEKLQILLAELHALGLHNPRVTTTPTADAHAPTGLFPDLDPEQRNPTGNGADQASIVEYDEKEQFLAAVATERPATVCVERHQGGYAARFEGQDLHHRGLTAADRDLLAEAEQQDQELAGFTAAFRSGSSVHWYTVQADHWVDHLEDRLEELQDRIDAWGDATAEERALLQEQGKQLYQTLINDDHFLTAQTTPERDTRVEDLARGMLGTDCPLDSPAICEAITQAHATQAGIIAERKQQAARDAIREAIPAWAQQLAALPDFRAATTESERAMLASNFLHTHHPPADTPEFVRLLRHTAANHTS